MPGSFYQYSNYSPNTPLPWQLEVEGLKWEKTSQKATIIHGKYSVFCNKPLKDILKIFNGKFQMQTVYFLTTQAFVFGVLSERQAEVTLVFTELFRFSIVTGLMMQVLYCFLFPLSILVNPLPALDFLDFHGAYVVR